MQFHGGFRECVIFDWWNIQTLGAFIGSAIAIFFIVVLYEALKFWREKLYAAKRVQFRASETALTDNSPATVGVVQLMFNRSHAFQTLLHVVQMCISYALMLVAMTYNAWLLLAIVLGAGCGYFLFGWVRQRSVDVEEHCH